MHGVARPDDDKRARFESRCYISMGDFQKEAILF